MLKKNMKNFIFIFYTATWPISPLSAEKKRISVYAARRLIGMWIKKRTRDMWVHKEKEDINARTQTVKSA